MSGYNIRDTELFSRLLSYAADSSVMNSQKHPYIVAVHPQLLKKNQRITQSIENTFNAKEVACVNSAVCDLLASGRNAGIVAHVGPHSSYVVAIENSEMIPGSFQEFMVTGTDINKYLKPDYEEIQFRQLANVKSSVLYCALDYNEELSKCNQNPATFKTKITIDERDYYYDREKFSAVEAIFKPSIFGKNGNGLHQIIIDVIVKSAPSTQKLLIENIVLSGLDLKIVGFAQKMKLELEQILPHETLMNAKITVIEQDCDCATWLGASILASSAKFIRIKKESDLVFKLKRVEKPANWV